MSKYWFCFFFSLLTCATCRAAFTLTLKDLQLQGKHGKSKCAIYILYYIYIYEKVKMSLHIKAVLRDLEEGLQPGAACIVYQQVNRTHILQRVLCSIPIRQVHTHRLNRRALYRCKK